MCRTNFGRDISYVQRLLHLFLSVLLRYYKCAEVCYIGFDSSFVHSRTKVEFSIGGESFHCVGQRIREKGFTSIMPWLGISEKNLPQFTKEEKIEIMRVELYQVTCSRIL